MHILYRNVINLFPIEFLNENYWWQKILSAPTTTITTKNYAFTGRSQNDFSRIQEAQSQEYRANTAAAVLGLLRNT